VSVTSRVDRGSEPPQQVKPQPKVPFARALQKPAPLHAGRMAPKLLERNQKASASFTGALQSRRAEAEQVRPEHRRLAHTLARLLVDARELERDPAALPHATPHRLPDPASSTPAGGMPSTPSASPIPAPVAALAAQLEALIARAEQLALAEGPALKLALDAGDASSIEVIRTGKGEVAVTLTARSSAERRGLREKLQAIRAALVERGLTVKRVTLAR
jgi:hypothetical protein